jgi:hypothetical protein
MPAPGSPGKGRYFGLETLGKEGADQAAGSSTGRPPA